MNMPFFNTPDRIAKLEERAKAWSNTPWRLNSMAIGVGVSCHNLPRAIYSEVGFCDYPEIIGSPAAATATNCMAGFLDAREEFQRLQGFNGSMLQPGDLVGIFIPMDNVGKRLRGAVVNHLGVMLENNRFVHTLLKRNTMIDQVNTPPWSQIVLAAWRPMETGSFSA